MTNECSTAAFVVTWTTSLTTAVDEVNASGQSGAAASDEFLQSKDPTGAEIRKTMDACLGIAKEELRWGANWLASGCLIEPCQR